MNLKNKTSRITSCFARAKAAGRPAFVAYLTMGYPTLAKSEEAVDQLIAGGADISELGVPFSDPFADGAVIRAAAYEALKQGVTLDDVLELAGRVRARQRSEVRRCVTRGSLRLPPGARWADVAGTEPAAPPDRGLAAT